MPLPLNLAMTGAEISAASQLNFPAAWLSCSFSENSHGLSRLPSQLPENSILILDDSIAFSNHDINIIKDQLQTIRNKFQCSGFLLDFQHYRPKQAVLAKELIQSFPCPVAVTPQYAHLSQSCPVFLPPAPLLMPLAQYITPWRGRELWLEAAMSQQSVTVTQKGAAPAAESPWDGIDGGFYSAELCCCYRCHVRPEFVRFTLFDSPTSLPQKLEQARQLGIRRAIGLYQQLQWLF